MTVNDYLRLAAGLFTLLTLVLGYLYHPYWHLGTAFVGLNLLQSAFTKWCPLMTLLRLAGVRDPERAGSHA